MYTQFSKYYRDFALNNKSTLRIPRKPGELIEVDWAGDTAQIRNSVSGEIVEAYLFVATLPYSRYSYIEAFLTMDIRSWITGHVNAFDHFGGVSKTLVPDNLKTGVTKPDRYDPIINKTYDDMAKHYNTVVIPARVRKPKDKPSVESEVRVTANKIVAAIRNQTFFSLSELNFEIHSKLEEYSHAPFQKREGDRFSVFLSEEKEYLNPLPNSRFEICEWKIATVNFNYHVSVDKMNYSVPYEYIKKKVDVRIGTRSIEIFYKNLRIASHPRLFGAIGQYHTNVEHMPEKHKYYVEWSAERFLICASKIGPNTRRVIQGIFDGLQIEQQGFKSCMGILKLADQYSLLRLESACERALSITSRPSYKMIKMILKNNQDKLTKESAPFEASGDQPKGFTRGANYYGGKP
jgi:transposase